MITINPGKPNEKTVMEPKDGPQYFGKWQSHKQELGWIGSRTLSGKTIISAKMKREQERAKQEFLRIKE